MDQYHRLLEVGILREGEPVELLDGLLVLKDRSARGEDPMTVGKRHATSVRLLLGVISAVESRGCYLQVQQPITLPPRDEPEPDGAIVRGGPRDYLDHHPGPGDVGSVIEVSDNSLDEDRTLKLRVYASAGIPQYVIVNLVDNQLEVYREVRPVEAAYGRTDVARRGGSVSIDLGSASLLEAPVDSLLP